MSEKPKPHLPAPEGLHAEEVAHDLVLLSFPLANASVPEALSEAEQEIALRVFAGRSNKEIAQERGVSLKTIGNQLESIYEKLGVSSRAELAMVLRGGRTRPKPAR